MKQVSAGVIIHDDQVMLIGHVTNQWYWDIPKGLIDSYESPLEAAIREVYEETAFNISQYRKNIKELGRVKYTSNKDLYLFDLYLPNDLPDISKYHCDSYCNYPENPEPEDFPEIDEFNYIGYDDMDQYFIPQLILSLRHFYPTDIMDQYRE